MIRLRCFVAQLFSWLLVPAVMVGQLPVIQSVSPVSGTVATKVQITGSYFSLASNEVAPASTAAPGLAAMQQPPSEYTKVYFGSYPANPSTVTSTFIEVPVPDIPVGSYPLRVFNANGGTTSTTNFTVSSPTLPPPPPPTPAITNIAFLHGFNSNASVWSSTARLIYDEFVVPYPTNESYDGLAPIGFVANTQAARLIPQPNSVVIGSSQGGLLAREIRRQQGSKSNVAALITVGTPHLGAPIIENGMENLGVLIYAWTNDIAYPWMMLFGDFLLGYQEAELLLQGLVNTMQVMLDPFHLMSPAALDTRPGSSFLSQLNSSPGASLPPAHYLIYSQEDWQTHWRLVDAFVNNGIETGQWYQFVRDVISYYNGMAFWTYWEADWYMSLWYDTGDFYYLDLYWYWMNVGFSFIYAAQALAVQHQLDWNQAIVGEPIPLEQIVQRNPLNDAVVPRWSQAPDFVSVDRKLLALHTNHEEAQSSPYVHEQIRTALKKFDINLKER